MQNINQIRQELYEVLSPELLVKISKNTTYNTLILKGEPQLGFLSHDPQNFFNTLQGAFQKNTVLKTLVFDNLSLHAINLLLPALKKIEFLILRNIPVADIQLICNTLFESLPFGPEIICEDLAQTQECIDQINRYNKTRQHFTQVLQNKKRRSEVLGAELENQPPRKKQRLEDNSALSLDTEIEDDNENHMDLTPVTTHVLQLAMLQNPQLFFDFIQFLQVAKAKPHLQDDMPNALFVQDHATQVLEIRKKNNAIFAKIHKVALENGFEFTFEMPVFTTGKKSSCELKTRFFQLAAQEDTISKFKELIPQLQQVKKSVLDDVKHSALLIAAANGNRAGVNLLMGGKIRTIKGEPTAGNIEAVLAEREVLVIKREQNVTLKTASLGYKDKEGNYQEALIGRLNFKFHHEALCSSQKEIANLIKLLDKLQASTVFIPRSKKKLVPRDIIDQALLAAFNNGHLSVMYDLLDYLNMLENTSYYQPSVSEKACFSNLLYWCVLVATERRCIPLLEAIDKSVIEKILPIVINNIMNQKTPEMLAYFLQNFFPNDALIAKCFQSLLYKEDPQEFISFFLDKNNDLYPSFMAKLPTYDAYLISETHSLPSISAGKPDQPISLYFLNKDNELKLILLINNTYQEFIIKEPRYLDYLLNLFNFNNMNKTTMETNNQQKFFRSLLLSLNIPFEFKLDPAKLAAFFVFSYSYYEKDEPLLQSFLADKASYLIKALINHPGFDLSANDNQFLRIIQSTLQERFLPDLKIQCINKIINCFLEDSRINPPIVNLNAHKLLRAALLCIKNGYQDILAWVLKSDPKVLSDLFLKYPKLMEDALQTAMQKAHYHMRSLVLENIEFYTLTPDELKILNELEDKNTSFKNRHTFIKTNSNFSPEYVKKEQERMWGEWKLFRKERDWIAPQVKTINHVNFKIIQALLTSSVMYQSKSTQEWLDYVVSLRARNNKVLITPYIIKVIKDWPKIRIVDALNQQGFFPSHDTQKCYLPEQASELIKDFYIRLCERP